MDIANLSIRCRMVKKKESIKLAKQDWIDLGRRVLAQKGVDSVRVEPLAKLLNVTKGSFYWHFKNREELLEAILQDWVNRETGGIIERVESRASDASTKLLHLLEIAIQDGGQFENAIRSWATNDLKVATTLDQIDRRRLDYTKTLFLEMGFTPFEAMVRARMVYYSLIGECTLGARANRAERSEQIRIEHLILTRRD